ncbi:cysteine-rich, DPF motif domain containing 1 [Perkinsus olseni]|uniref:Cysteine-rich DPF motif domain-containing protein 1 n=1 Tax=Perkinsus olseni TaxID=32597 RepID=A0A7J6UQK4_PEROL|nr:cysteine-rich, DPF motif domain containing 1 [Perkinsus olseni]
MAPHRSTGTFLCCLCGFKCRYDYVGQSPPYVDSSDMVFLEEVYSLQSPFSGSKLSSHVEVPLLTGLSATDSPVIVLGAECSCCGRKVCTDAACSVFYKKRYCRECVMKDRHNLDLPPVLLKAMKG